MINEVLKFIMSIKGKSFALGQASRRFMEGCLAYPGGALRGNAVTTYWGFKNFGDLITPFLLKKIGLTPVNSARVSFGEFVFVGSILDSIKNNYKGVILGSGFLNDRRPKDLSCAKILALRGVHTKKLCNIPHEVPLGDCGLILPYFIKRNISYDYELGIIPHYSDANDQRIKEWVTKFGGRAKIIDVLQDPESVFKEVSSCNYIVSSSLHGLVLADSLNIPSLWVSFSKLSGNGEFKFHDYYTAFNVVRKSYVPSGKEAFEELLEKMLYPPQSVKARMKDLYDVFIALPSHLHQR